MFLHTINPILATVGPFEIRWYGLVYVLGFFLAVAWLFYLKNRKQLQLTAEQIWDFVFYLMLGVLIGSRLFMIFWQPQIYLFHPLELLKIWEGGMSFHGGLVGIIIAAYLYCKKKRLPFWSLADIMSFPAMLALALGRIANFINGELVGKLWNGATCVDYSQNPHLHNPPEGCRYPSILYAAGYRFLISIELFFLTLKNKFQPGFIFWNFVLLEGIGRFIVDFYREDQLYFNLFSLGQWFSIVMIVVALAFLIKRYKTDLKLIFTRKV